MRLRSKRLARRLDPAAEAFLDSTREDAALTIDDTLGSLAHVDGLRKVKLLTPREAGRLTAALRRLHREALDGKFRLDPRNEDVHLNVEARLTKALGTLGKKVHTGRSRNDQVALDLRLFARRWSLALSKALHDLVRALLDMAAAHDGTLLPGYTHMQAAQPVLLSFHLQAHAERFQRDLERLRDAYARTNVSPLGAGALAGTRHALDPSHTARLLGFTRPFRNAMDAVSDRDFLSELLFVAALTLTHASGLAEEIILYTSPEFAFAEIRDDFATGSSIMPQKKNPDVFEVTRGRAGAVLGALVGSLATIKNLPLAYNRDLQDQKRVFVETYPHVASLVELLSRTLRAVTFRPARTEQAAEGGFADATDVADYLVEKGIPFRDAHEAAAQAVRAALDAGTSLRALPGASWRAVHPSIRLDVRSRLGARASIRSKATWGSTRPSAVKASRRALERDHEATWRFFQTEFGRVHQTTQALMGAPMRRQRR